MGFLDIFKSQRDISKEEIEEVPWTILSEKEQIDALLKASHNKTVAVFKHSTRCGVSSVVLRQFERNLDLPKDRVNLYYLDLIRYRDLSREISERLDVRHESPQLIIIKDGKAVHHESHHGISVDDLTRYV